MAVLHVTGILQAKPGAEGTAGPSLKQFAEVSRTHDGCIRYDPYESASTPGTFITVEEWRDQAALDAHLSSPELQDVLAHADQLFVEGGITIHPLKEI